MQSHYQKHGCGLWQEAALIEFESSGLPEHRPAVEDCHPQHAGFVYAYQTRKATSTLHADMALCFRGVPAKS